MKKKILTSMILCLSILMIGCNQNKNLESMSHITTKDYTGIKWNEKVYIPFCTVDNAQRGKQIGIVDNDKNDKVYEYKGYPTDEWIISFYHSGEMDNSMLMREISVIDIPDNLHSEYE